MQPKEIKMSFYEKFSHAVDQKDLELYASLLHEDYVFVRHQTGSSMNKAQLMGMIQMMFDSQALEFLSRRCVYENDEIMVEHNVMDFPDGTREAVLVVHMLQEGLIVKTETGATPIKKEA